MSNSCKYYQNALELHWQKLDPQWDADPRHEGMEVAQFTKLQVSFQKVHVISVLGGTEMAGEEGWKLLANFTISRQFSDGRSTQASGVL